MSDKKRQHTIDEYKVSCKLKFLAVAIAGLHSLGCVPSVDECHGAELLLFEIAREINPEGDEE